MDISYHDSLLFGSGIPPVKNKSSSSKIDSLSGCLPLILPRLPRSSPLSGSAGLVNASVNLEARIWSRGFLVRFLLFLFEFYVTCNFQIV